MLLVTVLVAACTSRQHAEPMDMQCDNAITQASAELKKRGSDFARQSPGRLAANLITAARIDQQQGRFVECLDRATRALKLATPARDD